MSEGGSTGDASGVTTGDDTFGGDTFGGDTRSEPHLPSVESGVALAASVDACVEGPSAAVFLFRSLADPARLTILQHLALGEHRVVDLTNHLGLAQSTTSAHLACLRDCGLVASRTVGRSSMYSLAVSEELMTVLAAAERLLAATGDAVTLCPTNHTAAEDHS